MNEVLLMEMLDQGYVRHQVHPTLPLAILNYAEKAVYEKVWNEVTLQCRGLIYNRETREVVARPFPKFFNIGEHMQDGVLDFVPTDSFDVFEKVDGSLGILYWTPDGYAIATRGSFTSEQALMGTEILRNKYPNFDPCPSCTYLFEIIYSSNRIVVDYGDMENLVLLDILETSTGKSTALDGALDCASAWPGPVVHRFHFDSLDQVLKAPEVKNAEGFVIRFADGRRVKSKFDEYVRLHAIVTNTSSVTVWECMSKGESLDRLLEHVPDEFSDWVEATATELEIHFDTVLNSVNDEYDEIIQHLDDTLGEEQWDRGDFARIAKANPLASLLFLRHDGKDLAPMTWRIVKPERTLPFSNVA
jgi:RNA ligase